MVTLRLIGDVHGHYDAYIALAKKAKYSIQLGDLGFSYSCFQALDPDNHKFLGGNHDNYSVVHKYKHYLGDYGTIRLPSCPEIFFVRGAYSIDREMRILGIDWWAEEQLTAKEGYLAIEMYKTHKREFVISHDCPLCVKKLLCHGRMIPDRTSFLLQEMFEIYQPRLWIFAHHHIPFDRTIDGTRFICLPELGIYDIELE